MVCSFIFELPLAVWVNPLFWRLDVLNLETLFAEFYAPNFITACAWIVKLSLAYPPSYIVLLKLWMKNLVDEVFKRLL